MENKFFYDTYNGLKLCGILSKINDSDKIAVICHPRTSSKDSNAVKTISSELSRNNINNFRFDFVSCGESDGEYDEYSVSHMIKNLEDTLDMLIKKYSFNSFILVGCSMGGRIVSLIDENKYNIKKIVLWYPALNLRKSIFNLPGKRERLAKKQGYYQIEKGVKLSYEYFEDERRYRADKHLYSIDIPLLFIHGTSDKFVPYTSSVKVSKKCKNAKLLLINGGDHGFHDDKCMKEAINKTLEFIKE